MAAPGRGKITSMEALDPDRIRHWLDENLGGVEHVSISLVAGGHSCLTYVVDTGERGRYVVRRPPAGHTLATAHDVLREHRIITALASTGVPVAPVVGACDDLDVIGAPFYVMQFVEGVVLHDRPAAESLSEVARRRAGQSMIEVLVALQAVDPDEVGLGNFAKRTDYLGRQLRRWHAQWQAAETRPMPRMDELHDWLVANQPAEKEAGIVHGDFRLGNAIHRPDGTVAALLDWELSTLGPPEADLAYLLRSWVDPRAAGSALSPIAAGGFFDRAQMTERYEQLSGREVDNLAYWLAFHAWRSACISAGVYTRYKTGVMEHRTGDFRPFEDAVANSLDAGLDAAGLT